MRYLLVNHIPASPGRDPAHLVLPKEWARDVAATARVARELGIELMLATPVSGRPAAGVEIVPDSLGFEHVALPFFDSARSFLRVRSALSATLERAIGQADLVQLDHGGHPVSLGHVADPIAKSLGTPTLWVVSGSSLPQSSLRQTAGSAAKRLVGRSVDSRLRTLLIDHLATAAGVICASTAVQQQLGGVHRIASLPIESMNVLDSEISTRVEIETRTRRLLDRTRPLRFIVTGEQNIVAGTDHVLRALHRCLRLRVPAELVILGDGVERAALLTLATELELAPYVRFSTDASELNDADVWLNAALTRAAEQPHEGMMAAGFAPILYRTQAVNEHVVTVPSGYTAGLGVAMFDAAVKREQLAGRMLAGIEHVRTRTLEAACRQRFEHVKTLKGVRSRPAA